MENKKYFFKPEKKVWKQGYLLTDENEKLVYEARPLKVHLLLPATVAFRNHLKGTEEIHKIGKPVTLEEGSSFAILSTKSYYKYDGKKIWDYLHELGVRLDSQISGKKLGMEYDIALKGEKIGHLKTSTPKGKSLITQRFWFDVETDEENMPLVFLIAFSIARTDQVFYD